MWEIYGEGGGSYSTLGEAKKAAKEFSRMGNEMDGFSGEPGEVNIWKDGTLYFTYNNGKLTFDGWTRKWKHNYRILNLDTFNEERYKTDQDLEVGKQYRDSKNKRFRVIENITTDFEESQSVTEDFESATEDLDTMLKYYPNLQGSPKRQLTFFLEKDPTWNSQRETGSYSKWILDKLNRGIIDHTHLGHLGDALSRFNQNKSRLKEKDIGKFKSLDDLDNYLNREDSYIELSNRQQLRQRQDARRNVDLDKDADLIYENKDWEVWVPKTYAASCRLGQGTKWCTASTSSDWYYKEYTSDGDKLYININKKNPSERYQFHFRTGQFMDKDDESINILEFFINNPDLYKGAYRKEAESIGMPRHIEIAKSILENDRVLFIEDSLPEDLSDIIELKTLVHEVVFSDNLSQIEASILEDFVNVRSVKLPKNLLTIGAYAFAGCESLENIELPESTLRINRYAFTGCLSLRKIVIPKSVFFIGEGAFHNDADLVKYVEAPQKPSGWNDFWDYRGGEVVWGYKKTSAKESLEAFEDLETMLKYYPRIQKTPREILIAELEKDPTWNANRESGQYSKWILDKLNKGEINRSNQGHLRDLLTRFHEAKPQLKEKDIGRFKSTQELDRYLNDESNYTELSNRQKLRQTQKAVRNVDLEKDVETVFEDNEYIVQIPKTYEASCRLGRGSSWCTATTENDYYYRHYTNQGPLYIIKKKGTDEMWQFHFESESYMDQDDYSIDLEDFYLEASGGLKKWLTNKIATDLLEIEDPSAALVREYHLEDIKFAFDEVKSQRDAIDGDALLRVLEDDYRLAEEWNLYEGADYEYLRDYASSLSRHCDDEDVIELAKAWGYDSLEEMLRDVAEGDANEYVSLGVGTAFRDAVAFGYLHNARWSILRELENVLSPLKATVEDMGDNVRISFEADAERLVGLYLMLVSNGELVDNYHDNVKNLIATLISELTVYEPYGGWWELDEDLFYSTLRDNLSAPEVYGISAKEDISVSNQEFTSAGTSIRQVPAVFKQVKFIPGSMNLDYGGGRYDDATNFLANQGVTNLVYDPYNRSAEHNSSVIREVEENGGADTATLANVLNVIKEPYIRKEVLQNVKSLLKPGGVCYIMVYEGDRTGNNTPTSKGFQLNRKTSEYLEEIQEVFSNVNIKGKLIIAQN